MDVEKDKEEKKNEILLSPFIRDRGNCFEIKVRQGGIEWLRIRKLLKVTASLFGQAAGLSKYPGRTSDSLINKILGIDEQPFTSFQKRIMQHGTNSEPFVRDYYCRTYKKEVEELGIVIPRWCNEIGVSVDGYVEKSNSIIEIKCPISMYPELVEHKYRKKMGEVFPRFYHDHIPIDHYCQMQGGMAILEANYCDYIVFSERQAQVCVTRVERDPDFWNNVLFPKLLQFINILKMRSETQNKATSTD